MFTQDGRPSALHYIIKQFQNNSVFQTNYEAGLVDHDDPSLVDPLGQFLVTAGSDQNLSEQNNLKVKTVIATGWTVGVAEGITLTFVL